MQIHTKFIKNLIIEVLLWYSLPICFLAFYVITYTHSFGSALSHLYLASLIIFSAITSRLLLFRIFNYHHIIKALVSALYTAILFSLLAYYSLVIIGLKSWGRVVSQELIVSYASQIQQFCAVLGFSYFLSLLIMIVIYIGLWAFLYFFLSSNDWEISTTKISPWIFNAVLLTFLIVMAFQLFQYIDNSDIKNNEPVRLTLWGFKPKTPIHSAVQGATASAQLNDAEEKIFSTYKTSTNPNRKNLILIVVDALRPDHMGVYGYNRPTTPFLSSLKDASLLSSYYPVHSSCSESACGLISLASSRYVHELPEKPFTIQRLLKLYGYKIHMILGGDHTNFYNLKEYYGPVDTYFDGSMAKGFYVNDDTFVLAHTDDLPDWNGNPIMLQYHLMSAHPLGTHPNKTYQPSQGYTALTHGSKNQKYVNFYDNGVLQTDYMIKQLLSTLKSKHYLDNSLVVITADHGEALGEHQKYSHANGVNEETLRIPLIFIMPDQSKSIPALRNTISQVDIAPTILFDFKMAIPRNWSGTPIQVNKKPLFTFFQLYPNEGLHDNRDPKNTIKYWFNIHTGEEFCYNLSNDPNETTNIIQELPEYLKQEWRIKLAERKL